MSNETIDNEKDKTVAVTVESKKKAKKEKSAAKEPTEKKKFQFGSVFSDLLENFGKGGWVLFLTMVLSLLVMVGVCLAVFFYSVRGEEQVMVPNVLGKSLNSALLELQVKELYPKISLRFSDIPGDEGTILEQDPAPESIVKAYRSINLTVSRGVLIEEMENYVGQNIDSVQTKLHALFDSDNSVQLAPIVYQKDSAEAGTILAQFPSAGTYLDHTKIYFVVSSNNSTVSTTVPSLSGMSIQQILAQMEKTSVVFNFTAVESESTAAVATVTSQDKVDESVEEFTRVNADITIPAPDPDSTTAYGVFSYTLPSYPFPVSVQLECSDSEGNITKLIDFMHPGKEITIPYMVKKNSVLTLYAMGGVVTRQAVQ